MPVSYYHPFYRHLGVTFPSGNVTFYADWENTVTIGGLANYAHSIHVGSDNLLAVSMPLPTVVSADQIVTVTSGYTAKLTIRDGDNRSAVLFSATTTPREIVSPPYVAFSRAPTAGSGSGVNPSCYQAGVTQAGIDDPEVLICVAWQLNATAGYTWPAPAANAAVTYSRHIFNVRVETNEFVQFVRQKMVAGSFAVAEVACQLTAVASGAPTFYSRGFSMPVYPPVVRDKNFI